MTRRQLLARGLVLAQREPHSFGGRWPGGSLCEWRRADPQAFVREPFLPGCARFIESLLYKGRCAGCHMTREDHHPKGEA
jgi:hypothetical protein